MCSIGFDQSKLILLFLYKPPDTDDNIFCTELDNLFSSLPSDPNSLVFCGEYNVDALVDYVHFNNLVFAHLLGNAYPVIFHPTRVMPTSATLIDHIFTNFEHIVASGVFTEKISDHYITFVTLNTQVLLLINPILQSTKLFVL